MLRPAAYRCSIACLLLACTAAIAGESVWVATPWQPLTAESAPPTQPSLDLSMAAARGGVANGLVLVSGAGSPVQAKAAPLSGPGGPVPVRLRYATRRRDLGPDAGCDFGSGKFLDTLAETPAAGEPVQAVWVSVDVPADTKPGPYLGKLSVQDRTVDVRLDVSDFLVPPRGQRALYADLPQSMDSVAQRYGVPPWSDRHFALLEPSLALAGRAGANVINIPVVGQVQFGNRTGMVVFSRSGEELVPDFSLVDRYLDLWLKHCGTPRFVVFHVWDIGHRPGHAKDGSPKPAQFPELELTVRGSDGTFSQITAPPHPQQPALWKAVVSGMIERCAKRGIAKHQVLLGQAADAAPGKDVVALFTGIDPGVRWSIWTHGYGWRFDKQGNMTHEDGAIAGFRQAPDFTPEWSKGPGRSRPLEPDPSRMVQVNSLRSVVSTEQANVLWRLVADLSASRNKMGQDHGYGKVGLDYWLLPPEPVPAGSKRKPQIRSLWGGPFPNLRYCRLDRGQVERCTVPGPDGALSTTRLEALTEGACEAEARLAIEAAIAAKRLDAATAKPVLVARYQFISALKKIEEAGNGPLPSDWNASLTALYALAATAQPRR